MSIWMTRFIENIIAAYSIPINTNPFQDYDDIGYNFLIGGDGNIYEGRGFGTKGAHSPCYHQYAYGIAFIGNFCRQMPESKALQAYEKLMQAFSR